MFEGMFDGLDVGTVVGTFGVGDLDGFLLGCFVGEEVYGIPNTCKLS